MDIKFVKDDYKFIYRTSALIFNKERNKILLFNVEGRKIYMLGGGKVNMLEESLEAIRREVKEELGYDDIDYSFLAISEEFVEAKGYTNQQINFIYKGIYNGEITETKFKGLEGDWINFEWVDIKDLDKYEIHQKSVIDMIKNTNKVYYVVENLITNKSSIQ